ncbi:MAG: AAA family ATPase [Bradyrhizobium sp.]|nr:AAA family ATPase [Bradyrhizobium sp.]
MAETPHFLRRLLLTAFRAYLQPKEFVFATKRCLGIFGPNAYGKSSIVDALEFVFSADGTLERLGQRTVNNQAGPIALAHNGAEVAGLKPSVTVAFSQGKTVSADAIRDAGGSKPPMPAIVKSVRACFVVDPIIRGHSLRAFVENRTAEQRYVDVATWLQLGPLVDVQKNLRQVRTAVKLASEDRTELRQVDVQVARLTDRKVTTWDETTCITYLNDVVIAPLDNTLKLTTFESNDVGYLEIVERSKAEEGKLGLDGLRLFRRTAGAIWSKAKDASDEEPTGILPAFEAAATALVAAGELEANERAKAKDATFEKLWRAAEPLFRADVQVPDVCPVCTTPLNKTAAGDAAAIEQHISRHLAELGDYAAANNALAEAGRPKRNGCLRAAVSSASIFASAHLSDLTPMSALSLLLLWPTICEKQILSRHRRQACRIDF